MRYQTILFDLDGTLTESGPGIMNSAAYALRKFGIEVENVQELSKFVGPPLYASFMMFYGFSREKAEEAVSYFREYFKDKGIFENSPYPGIPELLRRLKASGRRLIVATSKPEHFAIQIADRFGFSEHLDLICGSTMDSSTIEKADIIRNVLKHLPGADKEHMLMVGDRLHDVAGAHACGLNCAGVLYGYGTREELAGHGADFILESVRELEAFLLEE